MFWINNLKTSLNQIPSMEHYVVNMCDLAILWQIFLSLVLNYRFNFYIQ